MNEKPKHCGFRLSAKDYEIFAMKAQKAGLTKQKYFENLLSGKPVVELPALRELSAELKRVGNNLNQLVRLSHQSGKPDPLEAVKLQKELSEIWQLLRQLVAKQV